MRLIKNLHYTYGYKNSFSFQGYAYINRREVQFYDRMRSWEPHFFFKERGLPPSCKNAWRDEWCVAPEKLDKFIEDNKISTTVNPTYNRSWYHS